MSGEDDSGSNQQDPGTAQEQIEQQILMDRMMPMVPFAGPAYLASRMVPTAGGAGYQFDPAEVDTVISKLQDVVDKARDVGAQLSMAGAFVVPPAADGPSGRQSTAAVQAVTRARERNDALLTYAENFVKKLQAAKKSYAESEDQNSRNVGNQA